MEQQRQAAEQRQAQLEHQLKEQQKVQEQMQLQMQMMTNFYMNQNIRPSPPGSLPASAPPMMTNFYMQPLMQPPLGQSPVTPPISSIVLNNSSIVRSNMFSGEFSMFNVNMKSLGIPCHLLKV